jgi:hypothetical protein
MKTRLVSAGPGLILLFCGLPLAAQTTEQIQAFHSLIKVDRDRTIHVNERIEIINDNGFFDDGVHRRLQIKPASSERVKAGSFDGFAVVIDGQPGKTDLSQVGDKLDVRITTSTGGLSRERHLIELSYTAKHQFAVYSYFEDFNQNITGEWPVPIEKASVEVHFPAGLPPHANIGADTGLGDDFKFDCLSQDLPSGVRFDTTHALPPQNRLFLSARFMGKGYFRSNASEDGYWAVLQDHPALIPSFVALAGLTSCLTIGAFVWRRAPSSRRPVAATLENFGGRFWREVAATYGFALVMFALAIIPVLNFSYSGHGGPSWLLAPLCFPWAIGRILFGIGRGTGESRSWHKSFAKVTIPLYLLIALPLSRAAATSIHATFGLEVSAWGFYALMVSPVPWFFFT